MATVLDMFKNSVVGSSGKIFDYTQYINSKGDFNRINQLEVIITSWTKILTTPTRSMLHDPEFGSDLYRMIFEPADEETMERIQNEIITQLMRYDDRAMIVNIEILFLKNRKGFEVNIDVQYLGEFGKLGLVFNEGMF